MLVNGLAPDQADAVLLRVRAEREQAFTFRLREMFTDMRFMWPALGATIAVAICVGVAAGVLQASTADDPESLREIFPPLARPGTEQNHLRPAPASAFRLLGFAQEIGPCAFSVSRNNFSTSVKSTFSGLV